MNYKDLNVYQRAYKVAIDLHIFLNKKSNLKLSSDQIQELKAKSRDVLANIAEGFAQRTPKAKRYFNHKAREAANRLMMDLEFLRDIQLLPKDEYQHFYHEYEVTVKQLYKLNRSILEKETTEEAPVAASK